jgi:hypothetical protein
MSRPAAATQAITILISFYTFFLGCVSSKQTISEIEAYSCFYQQIIMNKEVQSVGARGGLFGAGGRFKGGNDPIMEKFNESINFDKRFVLRA